MSTEESLLLKNGRIVDPANGLDLVADLLVRAGKISSISPVGGKKKKSQGNATLKTIDCKGKWILPGLIDMHVHLREPGEEYKENIVSGTRAAAAGGFTAVACMPNTKPVNDCQSVTRLILEKARQGFARVYPVGSISQGGRGEELTELGEMKNAGVVAISDDGRPVTNSQLMRRALEYASDYNLTVISHPEDLYLSQNGAMGEGALSTRLGLKGIPWPAEGIMIYRDLALAEYTGQPVHLAHVSTRESVELIRRAKEKGAPITAETAPHYFSLTEDAVADFNTNAKMNPPLRTEEDRSAIEQALLDGTIDVIATDHAPHSTLEKDLEFDEAANGIIGLETAVPLTMALIRKKKINLARMVELLSINPARILKVPGGTLSPGAPADITVIDPDKSFKYTKKRIVSKSCNSPFIDWQFKGKAVLTIVNGRITFSEI